MDEQSSSRRAGPRRPVDSRVAMYQEPPDNDVFVRAFAIGLALIWAAIIAAILIWAI